jgi:hypothetical protein
MGICADEGTFANVDVGYNSRAEADRMSSVVNRLEYFIRGRILFVDVMIRDSSAISIGSILFDCRMELMYSSGLGPAEGSSLMVSCRSSSTDGVFISIQEINTETDFNQV